MFGRSMTGWECPRVSRRRCEIPVSEDRVSRVMVPSPMNRCSAAAEVERARPRPGRARSPWPIAAPPESADSHANAPASMRVERDPGRLAPHRAGGRRRIEIQPTMASPPWSGWFTCQMRSSGNEDAISRHDGWIRDRKAGQLVRRKSGRARAARRRGDSTPPGAIGFVDRPFEAARHRADRARFGGRLVVRRENRRTSSPYTLRSPTARRMRFDVCIDRRIEERVRRRDASPQGRSRRARSGSSTLSCAGRSPSVRRADRRVATRERRRRSVGREHGVGETGLAAHAAMAWRLGEDRGCRQAASASSTENSGMSTSHSMQRRARVRSGRSSCDRAPRPPARRARHACR